MNETDHTDASEAMSAEDQAIAEEVRKAFELHEDVFLAAALEKRDEYRPKYSWDVPMELVFRDETIAA